MSISVSCDVCGQDHKLRPELRGKRFKCKGCGATVRVPQDDESAVDEDLLAEESSDEDDFEEALPKRPVRSSVKSGKGKKSGGKAKNTAKSSGMNPLVIGGIATGAVALIGLAAVIWVFTASGQKPVDQPMAANSPPVVPVNPAPVTPTAPAAAHQAPPAVAAASPPVSTPAPAPSPMPVATTPPPEPPPATPQEELARLYQQIRVTRAECPKIYEEMMSAPGLAPAKKASIVEIDAQVWKLTRTLMEFEASGKVSKEEIDQIRAQDKEIRRDRKRKEPGAGVDDILKETVLKFCEFQKETPNWLAFYNEISLATMQQYHRFMMDLTPELKALLPNRSGDPELARVDVLYPLEIDLKSLLSSLDEGRKTMGANHALMVFVLCPPTRDFRPAISRRISNVVKSTHGHTPRSEMLVYANTAPQLGYYQRVDSVEDREEFLKVAELGGLIHRQEERGLYLIESVRSAKLLADAPRLSLKNPMFVPSGFRSPLLVEVNRPPITDDQLVVRFDFGENDDRESWRPAALEVLKKVGEKHSEWQSEWAWFNGNLFAVIRQGIDFKTFVAEVSKVATVVEKDPKTLTVVLKLKPAANQKKK